MKRTFAGFGMAVLVLFLAAGCDSDKKLMDKATKLEQQEKFAEAVKGFEKLAARFPESPLAVDALKHLASIYADGLQDFPKAIGAYERMITASVHSPDSAKTAAQAQFMIGYVYNNSLKDTAKAREAYQVFLDKYPGHELTESVKWELQYLGKDINEIATFSKTPAEKPAPRKNKKK
jgi:TolA-binding protein